jgi:hypothetical protein
MNQTRFNAEVLTTLHELTRATLVLYDHSYTQMSSEQNQKMKDHLTNIVKSLEKATTTLSEGVDGR